MTGGSVGGLSGLASPHLYFYDSKGVFIGDAGPSSINSILIASVGTTGTYYIVAGSHLNSGTGGYALAVSPSGTFTPGPPPPPPPPPPAGTAAPRLDLDAVHPDMLEDGDSILFKVEYSGSLTGDVVIGWTVRGTGAHPTDSLDFVRTSGEVTLKSWDDEVYIRLSPNEDKLDEYDETFEIEIRVISGNATISDESGGCTIINDDAGRIHPTVDELNNSFQTATRIVEESWNRGFVTSFGDKDYFAVTLTAGATYSLIVIGDNDTSLIDGTETGLVKLVDPQAALYDRNFNLITGSFVAPINSTRISYEFTPTLTETYYIAVREDGGNDIGQYFVKADLKIPADDYPASTTTTGRLSEGELVLANNERDADSDWFKVELVAGRTYSFYAVDEDAAELDQDGVTWPGWIDELVVALRDSNGNIVATEPPNPGSSTNVPAQITFTANLTGTYFLSVEGADRSQKYLVGYDELRAPPAGPMVSVQPGPLEGADLSFHRLRDGLDLQGEDSALLSVGGTFLTGSGSLLRFDTTALPADALYAAVEIYFTGAESDSHKAMTALAMLLGAPTGAWGETSTLRDVGDFTFEGLLPAPGAVGWYRIEITDLYNSWQDGTRANNGIILLPADMLAPRSLFHSSDAVDAALRPRLVVYERAPNVVQGSAAYEILTGGDHSDRIFGLAGDDLIAALGGADWIDGGIGADIIDGGDGVDTISYATSLAAVSIDLANNQHKGGSAEGDSLLNVEIVEGSAFADTLVGSLFVDTLLGGNGNDVLWGRAGNDRLDGGQGTDWMGGGAGDDSYVVGQVDDFISEAANEGANDRVYAHVSYTLGAAVHVEILSTGSDAGTAPLILAGNELNNRIIGNAGGNTLYGMGGSDRLEGLAGDDRYVVDRAGDVVIEAAAQGYDTVLSPVSYTLTAGSEIEALSTLDRLGTLAINLSGNELNNILYGNAGANRLSGGGGNDVLDGGAGADQLDGGSGNDLYLVEAGDIVIEAVNAGTDEIRTSLPDATAAANVENLTGLLSTGQTLRGNALNNLIAGGAGADRFVGGLGNDIYIVGAGDNVLERLNEGTDEVRTALAAYTLTADVERLTGTAATGQALTGNALANAILGGAGNDVLNGGLGADQMAGGLGNDVYFVDGGDVVTEAAAGGTDEIRTAFADTIASANVEILTGLLNTGQTLRGNALNNLITGGAGADRFVGGLGNDVYLVGAGDNVIEKANEGTDEVRTALAAYSLTPDVERLTGTSAAGQALTGNALANVIAGGAGNDVIDGGAGVDQMSGGLGNDIYFVADLGDTITDTGGATDEMRTALPDSMAPAGIENITGILSTGQTLRGNALGNLIAGGAGADRMVGGLGNDIYLVGAGDNVIEKAGEGTDEVRTALASYALTAEVERLTGTSAAGQTLTGNALANVIAGGAGNDVIDGGAGIDQMSGGLGNDVYYVRDFGDNVTDTGGVDEIRTALADTTAWAGVENITGILATGQTLRGNGLGNVIAGGSGADRMVGGLGDDIYQVGAGDNVIEKPGEGSDEVRTALASYTIGADVERLTGTSAAGQALTGNSLANLITGGAGADTLAGAGGADSFRYQAVTESYSVARDHIVDFTPGTDRIDLDRIDSNTLLAGDQAFTWIGSGAFSNAAGELRAFQSGGQWIVEGDINGDGHADLVIALTLQGAAPLGAGDFLL